jgi:hypothetical protein
MGAPSSRRAGGQNAEKLKEPNKFDRNAWVISDYLELAGISAEEFKKRLSKRDPAAVMLFAASRIVGAISELRDAFSCEMREAREAAK